MTLRNIIDSLLNEEEEKTKLRRIEFNKTILDNYHNTFIKPIDSENIFCEIDSIFKSFFGPTATILSNSYVLVFCENWTLFGVGICLVVRVGVFGADFLIGVL